MCMYMRVYVCECGDTGMEVRGQSRMWLSSFPCWKQGLCVVCHCVHQASYAVSYRESPFSTTHLSGEALVL